MLYEKMHKKRPVHNGSGLLGDFQIFGIRKLFLFHWIVAK